MPAAFSSRVQTEHGCAAQTYWPGSHKSTHAYFLEHPAHVDGSFGSPEGQATWASFWQAEPHASLGGDAARSAASGVQFAGNKGDVIIWHGWLMHAGSMNTSQTPRLALFGSFRHKGMHMPDAPIRPPDFEPLDSPKRNELRYSVPEDLWEHWGEGARRVAELNQPAPYQHRL